MKNLILISSIINTPDKPFNYISTRSVFTRKERFEQTKKTIESVKDKIPDSKILIVECSDFNEEETEYLLNNCDYVLNLWDKKELHDKIFGLSKSLGEGTITIEGLRFIFNNDLKFENFFKISGRYNLTDRFYYSKYNNDRIVCKKAGDNIISTRLYKFPYKYLNDLHDYLIQNRDKMIECIGNENLFGLFVANYSDVDYNEVIGVEGYIAVISNDYIDE